MRGTYPASAGKIDRDFFSLAQGDRLGVEFFDFIGGWSRGGGGDFDFDECFCEGFGIDGALFVQGLSIGINGEEVAAGGCAGEEWGQAEFV